MRCFNPLWINTALKHNDKRKRGLYGFNPLWINTALKPMRERIDAPKVSIPYGLTLLSNRRHEARPEEGFQSPMD